MAGTAQYLSVEEVAKLLNVDYQLIYRLVRAGKLPAIRIGRIYRIERTDLDEFLAQSKTGGTHACSGCGTTYASRHSLTQGCETCGAPICFDCWTRRGVRRCTAHEHSESTQGTDK